MAGMLVLTQSEFEALLEDLRLRRSEFEDIECKAAQKGTPERLFETLSSFSNRPGGGTILLGIDDKTLTPVGVGNPDQLQKDIGAKATDMEPPVRVQFQPFLVDEKVVVVVQVPETDPQHKPCYYKPAGLSGGAYIRVGDGDRRMTEYEIYTYLSSRGPVADDRQPVPEASLDDLDTDLITSYISRLRSRKPDATYLRDSQPRLLRTLNILTRETGANTPTLAGLLTFGRYPQQFYPNLVITMTVQLSSESGVTERFWDNYKAEGNLVDMLQQAMSWLHRNLKTRTLVTGLIHQEIPEYPIDALREAIVNAVVHRDYSRYALGTQVQIRLYPDRIEVQSPGGLYGPVTIDRLGEPGLQSARNPVLAKMLEDLGPMENRGSGIQTMLQAMRQAHLAPPRFDDNRTSFRVTFMNHTLLTQDVLNWLERFAGIPHLNDRQRYALAYLRQKGHMVNRDYQMLNTVDARVTTRELRGLVESGLVETKGNRGGTFYQLTPTTMQLTKPTARAVQPARIPEKYRPVYETVSRLGPISSADLSRELGMNRRAVNHILSKLIDMKLIQGTAPNPRSRNQTYVPVQ